MRIKPALVLAFCLMVSVSALAPRASAQQLSKEAKIEGILKMSHTDALMDQMMTQMKAFTVSQRPPGMSPEDAARQAEVQNKLFDLVKSRTSMEKMLPQYTKIYSDTFSEDEIDGIYSFYNSPAGSAFINKMPVMMPKLMQMVQAQMGDMLPEIEKIVKESAQPK